MNRDTPPGIDQATFLRLADAYRRRWPVRVTVIDPHGKRHFSRAWWRGTDSVDRQRVLAFTIREALRYGEPTASYDAGDRLYWACPVMCNASVLGALVAATSVDELFPGESNVPTIDMRAACGSLRELLEAENLTNAALLEAARHASTREQERAEAIHSLKLEGSAGIRQLYLREEPELIAAIRKGDRRQARRTLDRILLVIMERSGDRFELVRSYFMELVTSVCRTAVEAGGDANELLGENFNRITELAEVHSLEVLSPWLHAMLERIMDALSRHRADANHIVMSDALAYIQQHLAGEVSREDVAAAICVSPSHFSRLFKRHVGRGFRQTLIRMRADRGAELLAKTDQPIAAVARACGFADPSYFAKVFQQHHGESPRAYRQRARLD
ncbi:MAG: AraC family transcriptional regulator [Phycisphaerales bacterium]